MKLEFQRLSQLQVEHLPFSLTFRPQAPHLFIGDATGNLYCHDVTSGTRLATLQWHKHPVVAVRCYKNNLYSFDQLQNLVSWDLSTLQVNQTYSLEMQGNRPENTIPPQPENYRKGDLVEISYLQRDVDGKYIKLTKSVPLGTVATACFTHSGRYLIFGVDAHPNVIYSKGFSTLYMIDVETGSLVRKFDWEAFFSCEDVGAIDAIAISKDDTQLAASGLDVIYSTVGDWSNSRELIHQWCINDGAEVCCYEYDPYLYTPHEHKKIGLAFSPDMKQLLTNRVGNLCLWNVPSPESRNLIITDEDYNYYELPLHTPGVFDWSSVSNLVAFGSAEGMLRFIDVATVKILFEQKVSQAAIQQVGFSQNGEFLAAYSKDLTFEIWHIS